MSPENYRCTLMADMPPADAARSVSQVRNWWTATFEGRSENLHDVFSVRFGKTVVLFQITEMIPGEKITWTVTDSHLDWLKDKREWTGTRIQWTFSPRHGQTVVTMTHEGLGPEKECYENCEKGWNFYLKKSLAALLSGKEGFPDTAQAERAAK